MKNLTIDPAVEECKSDLGEQADWEESAPTSKQVKRKIEAVARELLVALKNQPDDVAFDVIEKRVRAAVFALGRLLLVFFLTARQEKSAPVIRRFRRRGFGKRRLQPRTLKTSFGKVRYWRTYMTRASAEGGSGTYPLDIVLGLTKDAFSLLVLRQAAKCVTLLSYDRVTGLLEDFFGWSPSKEAVEQTVYGLARHTPRWFCECPAPEGDGDVLVIQTDSKAVATASEAELEKRRGKRGLSPYPDSPRHRGRLKRLRWGPKRRKSPGDKSKNGKGATLVVMYTLERAINENGEVYLKGPRNKKVYATFESKRHAVLFARQEADKRGFTQSSGKDVQFVTDGDEDLACYVEELFPEAEHTIDVVHVIEYLWKAGKCLFKEESEEVARWVEASKDLLFNNKIPKLITDLANSLEQIPKRGPGNKGRRERLTTVIRYLTNRLGKMNYHWLAQEDLELSSGAVEGAVRYVIGERFDCGGMRWRREGAHALLQLRCIELNGDLDRFIDFVQEHVRRESEATGELQRLLHKKPQALENRS